MKPLKLQPGTMPYPNCWGLYSKCYLGVSRIIDQETGLVTEFPLSVGRVGPSSFISADANFGYMPIVDGARHAKVQAVAENVLPDLSSFSMRYLLDPHGDCCVASYKVIDEKNIHCELEFFNTSSETRKYFYNLGMLVNHQIKSVVLRDSLDGVWTAAKNYSQIDSYIKAFAGGAKQCITDYFSFGVEKGQLSESFGCWEGDRVVYEVDLPEDFSEATLYFRYVKYGTGPMRWKLNVAEHEKEFDFPQTCVLESGAWGKSDDYYHEWKVLPVKLGSLNAGKHRFEFASVNPINYDTAQIWLDGFYVAKTPLNPIACDGSLLDTDLLTEYRDRSAVISMTGRQHNAVYASVKVAEKSWNTVFYEDSQFEDVQTVTTKSYLDYLRNEYVTHANPQEDTDGITVLNLKSHTVSVPPHQSVKKTFSIKLSGDFSQCRLPQYVPGCYGEEYPEFPQSPYRDLLKYFYDTCWYNFCFPTTLQNRQSAFIAPAKYFTTPFSWDAGFVTLGMAGLCPEFSAAGANLYLTSSNSQVPFIYSGSPVPTQFYSFWSLFSSQNSASFIKGIYPSLVRMYEFFAGRDSKSNVDMTGRGLLTTYSYNYSLGIDDHPIQLWAYENNKVKGGVYPLILAAQVLRCAKIMRNFAYISERYEDIKKYSADISKFETVIEDSMWDARSGLYGWLYNDAGEIRRPELDGCCGDRSGCTMLPVFAGILEHADELTKTIFDPQRFWTRWGISSVDMQAPHYTTDGYWNGGIWPVMNWFVWRAMIETGQADMARRIALRIMDTWTEFYRKEHYCGEHFNIGRQRMEGVPNFTGLGMVIADMHNAYFKPHTVTLPFDAWITGKKIGDDDTLEFTMHMPFAQTKNISMQVVMQHPDCNYSVKIEDITLTVKSDAAGCLNFSVPALIVRPVKVRIALCDGELARTAAFKHADSQSDGWR